MKPIRFLVPAAFLLGAGVFLFLVRGILLPFILAGALTFLLKPVIRFFEMRGFRRRPVVLVLVAGLVLATLLFIFKVLPLAAESAAKAANRMPAYVAQGEAFFARLRGGGHNPLGPAVSSAIARIPVLQQLLTEPAVLDYLDRHGRAWPEAILSRMPSFASGILPAFELAFLVPFITFFLMMDGASFRERLLQLVPSRYVEMALSILMEIDNTLGRYLRGIAIEAFFSACVAFAGFWIIGLDYAPHIALLTGLTNMIPYVGPVVGGILGSVVAIFQWGSVAGILKVIMVCVTVRVMEDWLIQPLVLRRAVHLHPLIILFSLLAGGKLFGFWGLLFAIPLACIAKVLLEVFWQWYRSEFGLPALENAPEASRIPLI